jgi:hypothetical protein
MWESGMRILRAIIFAVGLVTGSSVQAQDVLSDNELFASYCLAYLSDAYRDIKPILDKSDQQCRNFPGTPTPCAELSRMARDGEADLLHRLDRLRLYLLARGLLTARTDVPAMVGLAVATNRGSDRMIRTSHVIAAFIGVVLVGIGQATDPTFPNAGPAATVLWTSLMFGAVWELVLRVGRALYGLLSGERAEHAGRHD